MTFYNIKSRGFLESHTAEKDKNAEQIDHVIISVNPTNLKAQLVTVQIKVLLHVGRTEMLLPPTEDRMARKGHLFPAVCKRACRKTLVSW